MTEQQLENLSKLMELSNLPTLEKFNEVLLVDRDYNVSVVPIKFFNLIDDKVFFIEMTDENILGKFERHNVSYLFNQSVLFETIPLLGKYKYVAYTSIQNLTTELHRWMPLCYNDDDILYKLDDEVFVFYATKDGDKKVRYLDKMYACMVNDINFDVIKACDTLNMVKHDLSDMFKKEVRMMNKCLDRHKDRDNNKPLFVSPSMLKKGIAYYPIMNMNNVPRVMSAYMFTFHGIEYAQIIGRNNVVVCSYFSNVFFVEADLYNKHSTEIEYSLAHNGKMDYILRKKIDYCNNFNFDKLESYLPINLSENVLM